jgi:hypothetical protein
MATLHRLLQLVNKQLDSSMQSGMLLTASQAVEKELV